MLKLTEEVLFDEMSARGQLSALELPYFFQYYSHNMMMTYIMMACMHVVDGIGLRDTMTVLKLQQKNLNVLQRYIRLVYAGDMKRLGRLLLRLPSLRTIATNIEEVFEQFIIFDRASMSALIDTSLVDTEDIEVYEDAQQVIDQVVITGISEDMEVNESGNLAADDSEDTTNAVIVDPTDHIDSSVTNIQDSTESDTAQNTDSNRDFNEEEQDTETMDESVLV